MNPKVATVWNRISQSKKACAPTHRLCRRNPPPNELRSPPSEEEAVVEDPLVAPAKPAPPVSEVMPPVENNDPSPVVTSPPISTGTLPFQTRGTGTTVVPKEEPALKEFHTVDVFYGTNRKPLAAEGSNENYTVNASGIDTSMLGRGYYGSHKIVVTDIFNLIIKGLEPLNRELVPGPLGEWGFRGETLDPE